MKKPVIHLANAGKGALECHATPKEKRDQWNLLLSRNWEWKSELATCKRCLAIRAKESQHD